MPYPSQIDAAAVLGQAIAMIEDGGVESLSMSKLATALNVKSSSLYRYFKNKAALLRAVNARTIQDLFDAMDAALLTDAPAEDRLLRSAQAYRAFAFAHPARYGLVFTNTIDDLRTDEATNVALVRPYQQIMSEISGDDHSLMAIRGFLALMHGFIMLELAEQLRRGGDLDAAFSASMQAYLRGWSGR